MPKVLLSMMSFVPIEKRRTTHNVNNSTMHKLTNKVYCTCVEENHGEFKAYLNMQNDTDFPDVLVIPFTEESTKLIGKTDIFSKFTDKKGKHWHIIRTELDSSYYTNPELYTPFRNNYVYSGYVVKIQNKMYFDVLDAIGHCSQCQDLLLTKIKFN